MCLTHGVTKIWIELSANVLGVAFFIGALLYLVLALQPSSDKLDIEHKPDYSTEWLVGVVLAGMAALLMLLNVVYFSVLLARSKCCVSLRGAIFGEAGNLHGYECASSRGYTTSTWDETTDEIMHYEEGMPPGETFRWVVGQAPREILTYEEGTGGVYNETLFYVEGE